MHPGQWVTGYETNDEVAESDLPYDDSLLFREYDPSNGLISDGKIHRTAKNPAGFYFHGHYYGEEWRDEPQVDQL